MAAGNADTNANDLLTPAYPCDIAAPNIICVGASDANDTPASFSDFSLIPAGVTTAAHVALFAPGVDVLSTWLSETSGGGCTPTAPCPRYAYESGTSMAAPEASGVLALMLAANPGLSAPQLKAALLSSALSVRTLAGLSASGGVLGMRPGPFRPPWP